MEKFTVKSFELTTAEGKRAVTTCNTIRTQMFDKISTVLADAGFEVSKAADGSIAIETAVDSTTGEIYHTRLAVSFTNKSLDHKVAKKAKAKVEKEEVQIDLFDQIDG